MQITRASQALLSSNSMNMGKLVQMKLWMTFHWVGLSGLFSQMLPTISFRCFFVS